MPINLFLVMGSFKIKKLNIKTITGVAVMIIEASTGDVKFIP